jgi:hypothetical protein
VPAAANIGNTRLRVSWPYVAYSDPGPCSTYEENALYYGVFTDFNLIVSGAASPGVGTPDCSRATASVSGPTTFCSNQNIILNANRGEGLSYQWQNNGVNIPGATSSSYNVNITGKYAVVVSDAKGCSKTSAAETVTVNAAPQPVISASGLVLSTGLFYAYQWYLNNKAIPGAYSQNYTATHAGSYTVFVSDNMDCSGTSAVYNVSELGFGTIVSSEKSIQIYPNPASSVLHIEAGQKMVNVRISSMEGRAVIDAKNARDIDTNELAEGVYIVRISDQAGYLLKIDKLVIAR